MQRAKVPVDMVSEQKNILGVLSTRQAIYLAVGGVILYSFIPKLFSFISDFMGFITALFICLITALPTVVAVVYLGFWKNEKHNMYRDRLLLIKIQNKTQYGMWRRGR